MTNRILLNIIFLVLIKASLISQAPKQATSGEIYHAIEKLNFLGTALYIAAHPDDENTRLISYISNELKANTAYLSLTRGDGGQNLIGTEISEMLGVLRTNELLGARSLDGGKQFFTRAIDFGYSKHPDETLKIWEKDKVLADVVWVIRNFKPDVVINRFDHRTAGRTHGHHTSSALLSLEAYNLTADPTAYAEQLEHTETWQVSRVFYNTSWWAFGGRDKFAKADKSHLMSLDVGVYYPLLGKSNTEIAALARSMHKCQGFGSAGTRGSHSEYLELLHGELPKNKADIFEGINTSWSRVEGGAEIGKKIDDLLQSFNFKQPQLALNELLSIKLLIDNLPEGHWKSIKSNEINNIISSVLGLYVVAIADTQLSTPGSDIELELEFTNRSDYEMELERVKINPEIFDTTLNKSMAANEANKLFKTVQIPSDIDYSTAYWLKEKGTLGCYSVEDQSNIGKALGDRLLTASFDFIINGQKLSLTKDILYSFTDRAEGEIFQPFEITPEAYVNIENELFLFGDNNPQELVLQVKSATSDIDATVSLDLPEGWECEPDQHQVSISQKGDSRKLSFKLSPPMDQSVGEVKANIAISDRNYSDAVNYIDYDHIPLQTVLTPAVSKVVKVDFKNISQRIAYIEGAGDKVAESLRQVGYTVDIIDVQNISQEIISKYDAVVVGIRALNVVEEFKFKIEALNNYVENGGTLIYQYNTTRGLKVKDFAPYPLKLSRHRVTVEESPVSILEADHQVLNFPNKITLSDFDGWVQERGLYFPDEWSEEYKAILSMQDPGSYETSGSLLIAKHGKGHFVYSGISWFRELPAGVPGAFRLFANILDLAHGKA